MSAPPPETHCGFIAVVGLPNAGKSTLMNQLVGAKVSIVSRRVQTTRNRVLGILIHNQAQLILIDTPGIFAPQKTIERAMVDVAFNALDEADCIIHIADASLKNVLKSNTEIIGKLPADKPVILVLNKTDKTKKPALLKVAAEMNEAFPYKATFMVSAMNGAGTADILEPLAEMMQPGPWLFDPDQMTDMPMRMMAAEITREKIFEQLHAELPYAVMVQTENWENFDNGSIKIDQAVYVERPSQKAIMLGKGGSRIKEIGMAARLEMEEIFGQKVHLKLFVKVEKDWAEKADNLRLIGILPS